MAIYSNTRDALVEYICKNILGDWIEGTATAGATTTLTDATKLTHATDYFQNTTPVSKLYIRTTTDSLAPIGEAREATDFAAGVITVSPAFTATVGAGDTYAITHLFSWDEICGAINIAIEMVAEESLFWALDETTIQLDVATPTYEYNLPTSFMYLYRVTMSDADGNFDTMPAIPSDQYEVVRDSTPSLRFRRINDLVVPTSGTYFGDAWFDSAAVDNLYLRLEGLTSPSTLSADTDVCAINPAYIINQAAAFLFLSKARRGDIDYDATMAQYKICQDRADMERIRTVSVQLPPNTKRCRE